MEDLCFDTCLSEISTTALRKISNGIVYIIPKEALVENALVVLNIALRCVFVGITYSHRGEKKSTERM
jgi:hypothetical protein